MKKTAVIGSTNIDFIMKMQRLPQTGETITDAEYMQTFGGKGANQALGAARSGGNVSFISCIGGDTLINCMLDTFKNDGIDIEYVFRDESINTGTALVMIGKEGDNYLSVSPGANYRLTPERIEKAAPAIERADTILLQCEIPEDTTESIIKRYSESKTIIWNFAPARDYALSSIADVDVLIVNESEAAFLCGHSVREREQIKAAGDELYSRGVNTVIITLGAAGSFVRYDKSLFIDAMPVTAVDTTAAGDVYCGSLTTALAEGKPLAEAVRFASAASALSVTCMGAQPSAPVREEIDAVLKKYKL